MAISIGERRRERLAVCGGSRGLPAAIHASASLSLPARQYSRSGKSSSGERVIREIGRWCLLPLRELMNLNKKVDLVDSVDMVNFMPTATDSRTKDLKPQRAGTVQTRNHIKQLREELENLLSQARRELEEHAAMERKQSESKPIFTGKIRQSERLAEQREHQASPTEKQMSKLILEVFRSSPATTAGVVAALSKETKFDPREAGLALVRQMQKAEGGDWTGAELQNRFALTSATLHRRRAEHRIVFWRDAKEDFHYPKWQFTPTGALLPGLQEVLQIFRSADEWRLMRYFLTPRKQLDNQTPLALLQRDKRDRVIAHARTHGQENTW